MNFLDMLRNNPRGWGNGSGPEPEIAYQDDGGNLYGFNNALLQKAPAPQQGFTDQSLTDMLIGIGSAPAKMVTGLASGMSPYGSEGFQVPPLAGDAWEAINAPGTILNEGMTPQDRDRTATNAAGFMMGGGLVAPKAGNAVAAFSNGSKPGAAIGASLPMDQASSGFTLKHVSPHSFDQLDQSKIGSGIGANTEGYGFYATNSDKLIDEYAKQFENPYRYEIRVNEDPASFLDWDYLSQFMKDTLRTEKGTSYAKDAGKPGIVAKNDGFGYEGTSNYTLFPHANASVVHKWAPDGTQIFTNGSKGGAAIGNSLVESQQGKGFTAYHGSPHDFDKFSLDKIGTGEGAQAYGHGLYFADAEDVAHSYKTNLANAKRDTAADDATLKAAGLTDYQIEQARPFIADTADIQSGFKSFLNWTGVSETPELKAAFADVINRRPTGKMYQVRINADPESFLDWDKPLSQQSEYVRSILEQSIQNKRIFPYGDKFKAEVDSALLGRQGTQSQTRATLDEAQKWLDGIGVNDIVGKGITASERLREAGIPGIRYLDGASRADGAGSSNYVVFDDSLIDILRKYGLTGGAIGAGSLLNWDDPTTY